MTLPALKLVPNPQPSFGPEYLATFIDEEFRVSVFSPVRGDPIFYPACVIDDCPSEKRYKTGLCINHQHLYKGRAGGSKKETGSIQLQKFITERELNCGPKGNTVVYSFEGLPEVAANELRFLLQYYRKNSRANFRHDTFRILKKLIINNNITTMFEFSNLKPEVIVTNPPERGKIPLSILIQCSDTKVVAALRESLSLVAPYYANIPIYDRDV